MSSDDSMRVRPGDVLAGKYQVERVLGAGGMGVVVAAHHVQLDAKVAIEFLLPGMLGNRDAVARFAREAKAAVKITSEHVARVLDVGVLETGAPYMVMEYLDGVDLAAWIQERGALAIDQAVEFVLQACVAVAEAHGLGIVHRDLKPANLFCIRRPDGQLSIKVLDFGISKLADPASSSVSVTKTSAVLGSPLYMSPEQMQSAKGADSQSDIWALGVILFELIAGQVPFNGEAVTEVAVKVATQPAPPLRAFRPDAPPGLEAIVARCLEKDRRQRFGNVADLAVALAPYAPPRARASVDRITGTIQASGRAFSSSRPPPSPLAETVPAGQQTIAGVGQTAPGFKQGKFPTMPVVVAVGLIAALAIGTTGAVVVRKAVASRTPPSAAPAELTRSVMPVTPPPPLTTETTPETTTGTLSLAADPAAASTSTATQAQPNPTTPAAAPTQTTPAAPATASTRPAQPPPAAPNCDPSFTLDAQGRKHFKPECFLPH